MAGKVQKATVYCVGAPSFVPEERVRDEAARKAALDYLSKNSLKSAIVSWFQLDEGYPYVYHAIASVTLDHVQNVVDLGNAHGLHAWYPSSAGETVGLHHTPSPLIVNSPWLMLRSGACGIDTPCCISWTSPFMARS